MTNDEKSKLIKTFDLDQTVIWYSKDWKMYRSGIITEIVQKKLRNKSLYGIKVKPYIDKDIPSAIQPANSVTLITKIEDIIKC